MQAGVMNIVKASTSQTEEMVTSRRVINSGGIQSKAVNHGLSETQNISYFWAHVRSRWPNTPASQDTILHLHSSSQTRLLPPSYAQHLQTSLLSRSVTSLLLSPHCEALLIRSIETTHFSVHGKQSAGRPQCH